MRIVKNEPHFISSVTNERFELENDEWFFKSTGEASYSINTHGDVFDRNGKFIKEMIIDSEIKHEIRNFVLNHDKSIVQINYDFYLLPLTSVITIPELQKITNILMNTFNTKMSVERKESRHAIGKEICKLGHSCCIFNDTPKITKKDYTKNYQNAISKYPDFINNIKWLYEENIEENY
jgi:hypothetical protein